MDYDDNDFQSQNLHLASEGSTKFPPLLRPYALPKFDFDESLQGHLRFDSLVETEVFGGIENNEDNQWIEAYSRGSGVIEFSSTAAESCSISRHNNVWSEATSSESVEMLLKSVGQEEFIPRQTDILESDACDELACLTKQMEPNPKPDDKIKFKDNVVDLQPSDCVHEDMIGVTDNVEIEQSLDGVSQGLERSIDGSSSLLQQHIHGNIGMFVSGASLCTDGENNNTYKREVKTLIDGSHDKETQDGSSSLPQPQDIHRNIDLPVPGGSLSTDGKKSETDKRKVETLADGSLGQETQDDSSISAVQSNIPVGFAQNITFTCDVLNIENGQNQVVGICEKEQSSLLMQTNKQDLESSVINIDSDTQTLGRNAVGGEAHHKPVSSFPVKVAMESGDLAEGLATGMSSLENSLGIAPDGISDLQEAEKCAEDTCSRDMPQGNASEDPILIKDAVMDDQSALNTCYLPNVTVNDDSTSREEFAEVSSSCQTCPNSESENITKGLETGMISLEDSLELVSEGISDLQKEERRSEAKETCIRDLPQGNAREDAILIKDVVMNVQSSLNSCDLPKVTVNDDSSSKWVEVEVSNSSQTCFQKNVDTVEKKYGDSVSKEHELLNIGDHLDTETLFTKSESSVFTVVDNTISTGSQGKRDTKGGGFYSSSVVATTKSCIVGEATQICENIDPDSKSEHEKNCKDVSVDDQESKKDPLDSSEMHCDVDQSHLVNKGSGSSSPIAVSVKNDMTTSTESVDLMPVNNSASQFISENVSSTSCEIDVPPPPSRVLSTHEVKDHNEIQRKPVFESVSFDEKEDSDAKIAEEAGILIPVGSTKQEAAPCPGTGSETLKFSDTSRQPLCKSVSNCLQDLGTADSEEIKPEVNVNVTLECSKVVGTTPVLSESTEKQGDEGTIPFINDDKGTIKESHHKSHSEISGLASSAPLPDSQVELNESGSSPAYPNNATCSPSITFGSLPEAEKNGNQVKASVNPNPVVSEAINRDVTYTVITAHDLKGNGASKDERNLTSEVNPVANLSTKDIEELTIKGKDAAERQPVPVIAANKGSTVVDESPLPSGLGTVKTNIAGNISLGSPNLSHGEVAHAVYKGTPERRTRRVSNKTAGKESSRKGRQLKEKPLARQSERGGGSTSISLSPPPGFQLMHSNEVQQYGHVESIGTKSFALLNASTSGLPDLNTSASPPVLFQQPFTDIQQIHLRAQIFVYGALIQGTVPDEAHMIAAFGGQDGGRSLWERAWHSCMERQHGQKSHPVNAETPLQSRSGPRATDLSVKGKAVSSPLGRASNKATPSIVNPLIPLSPPVWNLPTPSRDSLQSSTFARGSVVDYAQTLASLHPCQTPPRSFLGHNTSWISQAPHHGPWISSPIPAPDTSSHLSAPSVTDTINLSSAKGFSLPPSSGVKNVPPGLPASSAGLQSISVATIPLLDTNSKTVSHAQHSSDPKPKKRKKVMMSEDLGLKASQSQSQLEATSDVCSHMSTAVAIATPVGNVPLTTVEKSVVPVSPPSLVDHCKSDWNVEKRNLSNESLMKVKEARVNAEEASALSAAAVSHSLEIWKQLDKQKNSGLVSDIEAKLASAAVAIAAAAAVAKAAAAAANVASNAALQAKLMADEALTLPDYDNSRLISSFEGMSNLGKASPASILKGANGSSSSSSIIVAAKEAARRRVDAASAARKRAENMDAIVKAAELAAEAVSQAGKIVTMGDPLPFNDLVEAGPEGSRNAAQEPSKQVGVSKDMTRGLVNVDNDGDVPETSHTRNKDISSDEMGKQIVAREKSPIHKVHNERPHDPMHLIDGISISININEKSSKRSKGCKVSDLVNPVDVLPESETELQAFLTVSNGSENLKKNNMKEGSLVEVFKDGGGHKPAWFTGNILSFKDGKAYVGYSVLLADEGAGPLKEWVSLESEGDKPPRIRIARPLTGVHNEGTRKRRRTTVADYTWSVGDRVDAWIQESWQEGVITDKNKKDETTLTVHFPASGETSIVRTWYLRPSLIWEDGKWIEPSRVGSNSSSTPEGDTPNEKRPKLGSSAVEVNLKDKISKGIGAVESVTTGELRLLNLVENEKVFNIGKSSKNENKSNTQRIARSGLQKEGSRVVFGVPKPGKKRKFMDVSKHYVPDGTDKINDGNDSIKLANLLIPRGSGSREWQNSSKNDTKEKVGADTKPKTFKPVKSLSAFGRVIPPKEKSNTRTGRIKDSSKNASESALHSVTSGAVGGSILYSSHATSADSHPTQKASTSRASKGKLAPAGRTLDKVEAERALNGNPVKSTPDVVEPRRSNRRIQPTSRLLEGLQSSLTISKIPFGFHEKGYKTQNRNASRGNNQS